MSEKAKYLGNEYAMPQHLAVDEQGDLQTSDIQGAGLTKREDIAKHLMASLIQDGAVYEIGNEHWYAKRACALADALLEELSND